MRGVRRSGRPAAAPATGQREARYWGWHRLQADWAERLVADAPITPGELVLDLGAGDGALTAPLLATGAQVLAVELHPARLRQLNRRFAADPRVRVLELDLLDLRLPSRPFRVVANPPWSLAKPLVRALTSSGSRLRSADLVLQHGLVRDLADRYMVGRGMVGRRYRAEYRRAVPRRAFRPAPPGTAAVLRLTRR